MGRVCTESAAYFTYTILVIENNSNDLKAKQYIYMSMRWQTHLVLEKLCSSALERLPVHYTNEMASG